MNRRRYGTGGVYLRGRRWSIFFRVDSKNVRESTASESKEYAEALLQTRLNEIADGIFVAKVKTTKVLTEGQQKREAARRRDRNNQLSQKRLENPIPKIKYLVSRAKNRAIQFGREFEEDLASFILRSGAPTHCLVPSCGRLLNYSTGRGAGRNRCGDSPSIDRVDNRKGYTKKNARIICYRCNAIKNDGLLRDFQGIVEYMTRELNLTKKRNEDTLQTEGTNESKQRSK